MVMILGILNHKSTIIGVLFSLIFTCFQNNYLFFYYIFLNKSGNPREKPQESQQTPSRRNKNLCLPLSLY